MKRLASVSIWLALLITPHAALPADRLLGIHSARVMSQSMPWIAEEAGLFRKYDLEFPLVYIGSSPLATAAMLGGDGELLMDGGLGTVRAYVQGTTELVCIAGQKNILTQSILAKPPIKRLEDLKGKKVGVTRIGATTHYFATQAFRKIGMEAGRDYTMIQTGGAPEMLAALVSGAIDAGTLSPPFDVQAMAQGFQYVVYGPDLRIPQVAVGFMTRRSTLAKRPQILGRFMRVMAEAAKILHTDKEFTFKVLSKQLRVNDRKILESGYNAEIKVLEPRLMIRPEAFQAILDDVAQTDPRAKKVKPDDFIDRRFLDEMTKSGFFDKLWGEKS
jgi:ABC-type nitrate/sulfonate/bicarbonate transport system substrate-binding protein